MNPARLALYALLPLILLNSALWAWYVGSVAMAALWPLLGAFVAAMTNWSEPRAGMR